MIIKNIRLIDPFFEIVSDITIKGGKIIAIGKTDREGIDGSNLTLWPGFVDLHAHFRDPGYLYKEDLQTGSNAALAGGYTTVHLMANTKPVIDSYESYEDVMERAKAINGIHMMQVVSVTKNLRGEELIDISSLPKEIPFLSDDGKGILSSKIIYEAMMMAKKNNKGIMVHAEDSSISSTDYRLAEDINTIRDVYLSGKTGCKLHFSHVSTEDSVKAIKKGKEEGYPITCEVTPQHLYLSDVEYRVNPPIREKKDVDFIIKGLRENIIDAIGTDHAPHSKEDKEKGAPGMVGIETSFNICYKKLVEEEGFSLSKLASLLSFNPGKILGLKNKGRLLPGYDADFTIINLNVKDKISSKNFLSKSSNTPFEGLDVTGKILQTYVDGVLKYDKGAIL